MRFTPLLRAGSIGIGMALVLVAIVFFIADSASGPLLVSIPGSETPEEVPIGAALFFTVLGGFIGIGLAWSSGRLRRPRSSFVIICVVALVLYGIQPFTAAEETAAAIWLNVMHVAAAIPIVGMLAATLPAERTGATTVEA